MPPWPMPGSAPMVAYNSSPNVFFAFLLFNTICRTFESGLVAAMLGTIKAEIDMSYTMEGIVAASPDFGIVPAAILSIFAFQYFPAYQILVGGQFISGLAALVVVVWPTSWALVLARAICGFLWGFCAVHYPSWINIYGGKSDVVWLGLYNACLLVGVLVGYTVGAVATVDSTLGWQYYYGLQAVLMLLCGIMYCFIDPALIQVTPRVRPLNLLKACGGSFVVGGGDAVSQTNETNPESDSSDYDNENDGSGSRSGSSSSGGQSLSLSSLSSPVAVFSAEAEQAPLLGDLLFAERGSDENRDGGTHPGSGFSPSFASSSASSYSSLPQSAPERTRYIAREGDRDPTKLRAREAIAQIFQSPLYLWTVTTGAIISGSVVFILYFVTQILEALDFFGSTTTNFVFCGLLLVASPIPGNLAGAYYVQKSLGGYRNYAGGTLFVAMATLVGFVFLILLTVVALLQSAEQSGGDSTGWVLAFLYVLFFYFYLFFGAAPTATINGTAVSLMPELSVAGSGLQFAIQNVGKLVIPAVGGVVLEIMNHTVVLGFQVVLLLFGLLGVLAGYKAYRVALEMYPPSPGDEEPKKSCMGGDSNRKGGSPREDYSPSSSSSSGFMPTFVSAWWSRLTKRWFNHSDDGVSEKRLSGTYGSAGSYNADLDDSRERSGSGGSPSHVELNAIAGGVGGESNPSRLGYESFADRKNLTRR